MASGIGTIVLDLGLWPGVNDAYVDVTGLTTISSTSSAEAFIMGSDTTSQGVSSPFSPGRSANDHRWFNCLAKLTCGTPTTATGFRIYMTSLEKLSGRFNIHYIWAD